MGLPVSVRDCICLPMSACICMCLHVSACVLNVYVCVCQCLHVCVCVCVCVCMCLHVSACVCMTTLGAKFISNDTSFRLADGLPNDGYLSADGLHLNYRGPNRLATNLGLTAAGQEEQSAKTRTNRNQCD